MILILLLNLTISETSLTKSNNELEGEKAKSTFLLIPPFPEGFTLEYNEKNVKVFTIGEYAKLLKSYALLKQYSLESYLIIKEVALYQEALEISDLRLKNKNKELQLVIKDRERIYNLLKDQYKEYDKEHKKGKIITYILSSTSAGLATGLLICIFLLAL